MLDYAPDLQVSVADMAKLPEGVLWQDVVPGDSLSAPAAPGDSVEIAYEGWLPNGVQADSASVAVRVGTGSVLLGLDLSLPGMLPGGRRKIVLTPGLAYGAEGTDAVPPNTVLVYDLVLLRIVR
jgi:peptidylprolyl isomerase